MTSYAGTPAYVGCPIAATPVVVFLAAGREKPAEVPAVSLYGYGDRRSSTEAR